MENLKRFLAIAAVVTLLNGICYTLFPAALLPNYGIEPSSGAALGFRFLGAALLTFGLILWFIRQSHDWTAMRAVLIGATVGNVIGVIVSLWATLTGAMNGAGWLFVVTYAVLLLGYAYSLWAGSRKFAAG
jgi:xanthine/uracil permease